MTDCSNCKYYKKMSRIHYCKRHDVNAKTLIGLYNEAEECQALEIRDSIWEYDTNDCEGGDHW